MTVVIAEKQYSEGVLVALRTQRAMRMRHIVVQGTNSSQTQQFYYIITFKATCFDCIESSSGPLENRSSVSTFIVHCGIPKAYNRLYIQYNCTF